MGCERCARKRGLRGRKLVRERGLEPPPFSGPDPKSGASAISPLAQPMETTVRLQLDCIKEESGSLRATMTCYRLFVELETFSSN